MLILHLTQTVAQQERAQVKEQKKTIQQEKGKSKKQQKAIQREEAKIKKQQKKALQQEDPKPTPKEATIEPVEEAAIEAVVQPRASVDKDVPLQGRYMDKVPTYAKAYIDSNSGVLHGVCFDAGPSISLIDLSYLKKHFPTTKIESSSAIQLEGVGSNTTHGWAELTVNLLGPEKQITIVVVAFHVVASLSTPILIGNDVLVPEDVSISLGQNFALFGTTNGIVTVSSAEEPLHIGDNILSAARTTQAFVIRPGFQGRIPIEILNGPITDNYFLSPIDVSQQVLVANSVAKTKTNKHYARVMNMGRGTVTIPSGSLIGRPRPVVDNIRVAQVNNIRVDGQDIREPTPSKKPSVIWTSTRTLLRTKPTPSRT